MKLVKVQSHFISKQEKNKGEKVSTWNYYIQLDNGNYIAIKPSFKNDYKLLFLLAETNEKND